MTTVRFFIDECLLYDQIIQPQEGWRCIDYLLGYRFIKKAMWASPASIRSNATSLKRFYTFLHEIGMIDDAALSEVRQAIKEGLPEWVATVERYDDLTTDDPFGPM